VEKLPGLDNLGNTCYLNSALQCLFSTKSISSYFVNCFEAELLNWRNSDNLLTLQFAELMREVKSASHKSFSPRQFLHKLQVSCPFFRGFLQQDSQEFLKILLDKLHETTQYSFKRDLKESIVSETFKFQVESSVHCSKCGKASSKLEDYYEIPLMIPSKKQSSKKRLLKKLFSSSELNLYDCLLHFCLPEELSDKYFCEFCQAKTKSQKETKVLTHPNVLVLFLKRFRYNKVSSKISTPVQLPLELNLEEFLKEKTPCFYSLKSFVSHSGGVRGGHYIAYCKVGENWFEFNDSKVNKISEEKVLEKEAYIVFYEKVYEPRLFVSQEHPLAYVPTYWLNKYYTLADPGCIYQNYLLCKHKQLKHNLNELEFTAINSGELQRLSEIYGIEGSLLTKVSKCVRCTQQIPKLEERIKEEQKLIKSLKEKRVSGEGWYIVCKKWLDNWEAYCSMEGKFSLPPPIDNSCLVESEEVKLGLEANLDYKGVGKHVWQAFMLLYGGGPAIVRTTPNIYSTPLNQSKSSHLSIRDLAIINSIKNIAF